MPPVVLISTNPNRTDPLIGVGVLTALTLGGVFLLLRRGQHPASGDRTFSWRTLGPVVMSQPVFKSMERTGGGCVLTWYSIAGQNYRVQVKSDFSNPAWNDVPGDVLATDALAAKTIPLEANGQKFFRVLIP